MYLLRFIYRVYVYGFTRHIKLIRIERSDTRGERTDRDRPNNYRKLTSRRRRLSIDDPDRRVSITEDP